MIQELKSLSIEPIKRSLVSTSLKETNSIARNTYLPLLKKNCEKKLPPREENIRFYEENQKKETDLDIENPDEKEINSNCDKKEDCQLNENKIDWANYKPKEYSILK